VRAPIERRTALCERRRDSAVRRKGRLRAVARWCSNVLRVVLSTCLASGLAPPLLTAARSPAVGSRCGPRSYGCSGSSWTPTETSGRGDGGSRTGLTENRWRACDWNTGGRRRGTGWWYGKTKLLVLREGSRHHFGPGHEARPPSGVLRNLGSVAVRPVDPVPATILRLRQRSHKAVAAPLTRCDERLPGGRPSISRTAGTGARRRGSRRVTRRPRAYPLSLAVAGALPPPGHG
jgi:hypothetical protein